MKKYLLSLFVLLTLTSSAFAKMKVNVDFQKYFDEQKNPVVRLEIDGKESGEYSADPTAKSDIYFDKQIKFIAEGRSLTVGADGSKVTLEKSKKGVWKFHVNGKKLQKNKLHAK